MPVMLNVMSMPTPKQIAKENEQERDAEAASDAQKAVAEAKKLAAQDKDAKDKAAQTRLKPVDPKEIDELNRQILSQEDLIDEHKDKIAEIKTAMKSMRDKRKELMQALKDEKKVAEKKADNGQA